MQLIVEHLAHPQARAALQSLVGEVLNAWLNLEVFCSDGRAYCKKSVCLTRLHELLHQLNSQAPPQSGQNGLMPSRELPI